MKNWIAERVAKISMSHAKMPRRPIRSAIGPVAIAPKNSPARVAAPSRPIHSGVRPRAPVEAVMTIPMMPRMNPSLNCPPVPAIVTRIWNFVSGASS